MFLGLDNGVQPHMYRVQRFPVLAVFYSRMLASMWQATCIARPCQTRWTLTRPKTPPLHHPPLALVGGPLPPDTHRPLAAERPLLAE